MIVNGINPETQEVETGIGKLTLKASGDTYKQLAKRLGTDELAVVILVPSDFAFTLAGNIDGDWIEGYKGAFTNTVTMSGESEFMNPKTDAIGITGVLTTGVPDAPGGKYAADATELNFTIEGNPPANESSMKFSFEHNGKNMIELGAVAKYTDKQTDFSQFTTSKSILDYPE